MTSLTSLVTSTLPHDLPRDLPLLVPTRRIKLLSLVVIARREGDAQDDGTAQRQQRAADEAHALRRHLRRLQRPRHTVRISRAPESPAALARARARALALALALALAFALALALALAFLTRLSSTRSVVKKKSFIAVISFKILLGSSPSIQIQAARLSFF